VLKKNYAISFTPMSSIAVDAKPKLSGVNWFKKSKYQRKHQKNEKFYEWKSCL